MSHSCFSSLPLSQSMLANLEALGYTTMTPIQAQSLPYVFEGQDVIAQARTGSGKTAAFGLGLLHRLNPRFFGCQALVLCPTRELAGQVAKEIRRLARGLKNIKVLTLCGGQPLGPQIGSLEHGAHIVVGTPGRVLKHLGKGTLKLNGLNTLVLDEGDRMLDMGFYDNINEVISHAPARRQTLLFSATFPDSIKQLAESVMHKPKHIEVASQHKNSQIEQRFYEIDPAQRGQAVTDVIFDFRPVTCVVFCATKKQCQEIAEDLRHNGLAAQLLNSDLEQRDRDEVLTLFAGRSLSVLVATDVAARGLDIESLDLVINAELSRDPQTHIHRVGRTGRAGKTGLAINLVTPRESHRAKAIEKLQGPPLNWHALDSLNPRASEPLKPQTKTLCIAAGRRDKLRPGDILGALTGDADIAASKVGKITITANRAYVAIDRDSAKLALGRLLNGKIKGRKLRVRQL